MKPSKYKNVRTIVGDIAFDSKKESKRYHDLIIMAKLGEIERLTRQVRFPIEVNGHKVCTYVADFAYYKDGKMVIEDVKSDYTRKLPVYRLKYKLMAAVGLQITEV